MPPQALGEVPDDTCAAVLCDSLYPVPFSVSQPEVEELLTACALDNADRIGTDPNAFSAEWACFLVAGPGRDL